MINPNYQISPVESADLPFLVKFIHSAKLSLSINRLLYQPWPSKDVQRNQYAKAVEGAFGDSSMESFKATDKESNEIIGYIVLEKQTGVQEQPTTAFEDAETSPEQKFPKEMNPGLLAEVSRANTKLKKATEHLDRVGKSLKDIHVHRFFSKSTHRIGLHLCRALLSRTRCGL